MSIEDVKLAIRQRLTDKGFQLATVNAMVAKMTDILAEEIIAGGQTAAHNLLSATHPNTVAASAQRGDLIVGNADGKFTRLPRGSAGQFLKMGADDAGWAALSYEDLPSHSHAWSDVSKTGSSLAHLETRAHSSLQSIGANDHHNQQHTLTGTDHTVSGLTTGHVMRATGATSFAFGALQSGDLPALGANPSATIGLSAVNGVATTYIRSDGAPALSQAIAPTWTATHRWGTTNKIEFRDAALYISSKNDGYLDFDADTAFRFNTGAVGIGIAPIYALHVYRTTPTSGIVSVLESGSASGWLQLKTTGTSWQIGSTAQGLQFYNDNSTAYRVTFTNTGAVGIGTAAPAATLDVRGQYNHFGSAGGDIFTSSATINFDYTINGNGGGWINHSGYNHGFTQYRDLSIGNGKGSAIAFFDGSNGYFGVGTAPGELLHIKKDHAGDTICLIENPNDSGSAVLEVKGNSGGLQLRSDSFNNMSELAWANDHLRIRSRGHNNYIKLATNADGHHMISTEGTIAEDIGFYCGTNLMAYMDVSTVRWGFKTNIPDETVHIKGGNLRIENGNLYSGAIIIDDDIADSIAPGKNHGVLVISCTTSSIGAVIAYDCDGSASIQIIAQTGTSFVVGTGALTTGSGDGTDGKFNINTHSDGKIYFKNRMGGT